MHFDDNEIRVEDEVASPHIPLQAVASNITETLAQIRASVDQIRFEQIRHKYDVDRLRYKLLMHVRDIEKKSTERFDELDRLGDIVDFLKGGDAKKGEGSSSRPQPPPDDHSRPNGGTGGSGSGAQGQSRPGLGSSNRGSGSGISQSRGNRSGSSKRRSSGGESPVRNVRYGPYPPTGVPKRSAKHWITGEKDF
ncbi:hypothetical protein F511_34150 [Dorcoceras hygrometricum]|uniref:Uncharacterized protein n=1 Tax=Dorcoceras hygrometricum TaxID=472368 RepID=A0A2Z7BWM1_9LAMI|nr:hypothetical protein F511_34150 [Dorcoceras hygrometricum]